MARPQWSVPGDLKKSQLLILAWTEHYFGPAYLEPRQVDLGDGRSIRVNFTGDRSALSEADAVWFHGPSISDLPTRKTCPWVLMSMESDVNYPPLKDPIVKLRFDLLMTYRLDSDIPCIYPNWRQYGSFLEPAPGHRGPADGPLAVYIASNPVTDRDAYVQALQQHITVDCPGRCLHNTKIPSFVAGGWENGAWQSLLSTIPRYKFYLTFENSQTTDYVTERVFHALACGVVPVYRGAGNVGDFIPHPEAIIDTADFCSPAELAEYLRQLDHDDSAYTRHLQWKDEGYSERFAELVDLGSVEPLDRLAIKLAHGCTGDCACGGRMRDPGILP